jgi:hypothetical protein
VRDERHDVGRPHLEPRPQAVENAAVSSMVGSAAGFARGAQWAFKECRGWESSPHAPVKSRGFLVPTNANEFANSLAIALVRVGWSWVFLAARGHSHGHKLGPVRVCSGPTTVVDGFAAQKVIARNALETQCSPRRQRPLVGGWAASRAGAGVRGSA